MACNCHKPCGKDVCCSVCPDAKKCEFRCKKCVPDTKKKKRWWSLFRKKED